MIFPLLKTWFAPFLPSTIRSSSNRKGYKAPASGFVTIGGSGGASVGNRKGQLSACHVTANMSFDNESEEHIVKGKNGIRMQALNAVGGTQQSLQAIVVSKQVSITTEDCNSEHSADSYHPA